MYTLFWTTKEHIGSIVYPPKRLINCHPRLKKLAGLLPQRSCSIKSPKFHRQQGVSWRQGLISIHEFEYKDLSTCSLPRLFGAALDMENNCRRRKSKNVCIAEEAMIARLVHWTMSRHSLESLSFLVPRGSQSQAGLTSKLAVQDGRACSSAYFWRPP